LTALKNDFEDFEDLIQYSIALQVNGLEAIITRNVKNYRKSAIAVMTPLIYLKMRENNKD